MFFFQPNFKKFSFPVNLNHTITISSVTDDTNELEINASSFYVSPDEAYTGRIVW